MAELLVRVVDTEPSNPSASQRADVISVHLDGWGWGDQEHTLAFWRIVKMPNVSIEAAQAFLTQEVPADPNQPAIGLRFRMNSFDLSVLDPAYLADDARAVPDTTLPDPTDATMPMIRKT